MTTKESVSPAGEIFTLHIRLLNTESVEGSSCRVDMISFEGATNTPWFRGQTLPGGVDTQIHKAGNPGLLSARYILEGQDCDGQDCRIFIENNGTITSDGQINTKPTIYTDSSALKWLEGADLFGTVEFLHDQLIIHISQPAV